MAKYGITAAIGGRKRRERAQFRTPTRRRGGTGSRVSGYVITSPTAMVTMTVDRQTITLLRSSIQNPLSISTLPYDSRVRLRGNNVIDVYSSALLLSEVTTSQ